MKSWLNCPLCDLAGRRLPLLRWSEVEQTTLGGLPGSDPNRYRFGVECENGHRYSVAVRDGVTVEPSK